MVSIVRVYDAFEAERVGSRCRAGRRDPALSELLRSVVRRHLESTTRHQRRSSRGRRVARLWMCQRHDSAQARRDGDRDMATSANYGISALGAATLHRGQRRSAPTLPPVFDLDVNANGTP